MINNWFKSSYSGKESNCVEAGGEMIGTTAHVGVRDTKDTRAERAQLGFSGQAWTQFLATVVQ